MTEFKSLFSSTAIKLVSNNWRPLPGYEDTKRPSISKWNQYCKRQWKSDELIEMVNGRGLDKGKIVCLAVQNEIIVIDIDVEDEEKVKEILKAIEKHLGITPLIRIGRAPRCLLVFRSDGNIRSRKHHPIEIFSGSGQFVAFGYHAGAGKDYEWPIKSPLDLSADDPLIPIISQQQIDQFLDAIKEKVQFKTTPAKEYKESLFLGDTLVNDRETILSKIIEEADILARLDEGSRNDQLFRVSYIAGQAMAAGLVQLGEVENTILNAASICGLINDYDGNQGVRATMRSGFNNGAKVPFFLISKWFEPIEASPEPDAAQKAQAAPESTKERDDPFDYDDASKFEFPPSLVKNLLPKTGIAFIGGQSGAGKTFLAVDLAIALSDGQPFFGRKVKEKVGVAILAGEGAETLRLRVNVARQARNIKEPLPIAWMPNVPNLADSRNGPKVLSQLRRLGQWFQQRHGVRLGVVIFDTLAATFLLQDENDNSEAAKVIKVLANMSQSLDCLVMPVHHYGKGAETGLRGASAWRAGSDAVLSVTADRNQLTGVVSNHFLWLAKSRVGEEGPVGAFSLKTMFVGLDEDNEDVTSCYVVPEVMTQISDDEIAAQEAAILQIIKSCEYRTHCNSPDWAGHAIAPILGLNSYEKTGRDKISKILIKLKMEKKIKILEKTCSKGKKQKIYEVLENKMEK